MNSIWNVFICDGILPSNLISIAVYQSGDSFRDAFQSFVPISLISNGNVDFSQINLCYREAISTNLRPVPSQLFLNVSSNINELMLACIQFGWGYAFLCTWNTLQTMTLLFNVFVVIEKTDNNSQIKANFTESRQCGGEWKIASSICI